MEDILYAYEHDPCSQRLLKSLRPHYYIFVPTNPYNVSGHHLAKHDNDISLSKQYVHLNGLHYVNYFYIPTYRKDTKKNYRN